MKVYICEISDKDRERYKDFATDVLAGRKAVQFKDDDSNLGILYMEESMIDRLGIEYLEKHSTMHWSDVCEEWVVTVSQNAYYNDLMRYPPKTIPVQYVEDKVGEYTEVWRNTETGQYYLRMLCNEPFARWMTCGNRMTGFVDWSCIRANITFQNIENGQTEKVTYNDWNGNAAYQDTYNAAFRDRK